MESTWSDKKRYFGLPISFTKYHIDDTRLFRETGLLTQREEEVLLYRVRDISLSKTIFQRLFGVGSVTVMSSDKTSPSLVLENIKEPNEVKELIFRKVEAAKNSRRMRTTELIDNPDGEDMEV